MKKNEFLILAALALVMPATGVSNVWADGNDPHPSGNRQLDKIENSTLSISWNGNGLFTLDGDITYSYVEINPITHELIDAGVVRLGLQTPYVSVT